MSEIDDGPTVEDLLRAEVVRLEAEVERLKAERDDVSASFHRAWTAAVGTPDYSKLVWLAAEAQLNAALREATNHAV